MDNIQKFYSDIEKIKKHYRAENSGNYDGLKCCSEIVEFFCKDNSRLLNLAQAFSNYWNEKYIVASAELENEPTAEHADKLAGMYSLLNGSTDYTDALSDEDWHELCELTNYEAEDLPIDDLNDLMIIFVDKKAL